MKRTGLTLAAMLSIMPATIAHAQFGSGIVLDPTQSAHAITQIEHEERSISNQVQQIENGQQIFSNTVKIASTALQTYNQVKQQYNLYHQMILAPRMLYSRFLSRRRTCGCCNRSRIPTAIRQSGSTPQHRKWSFSRLPTSERSPHQQHDSGLRQFQHLRAATDCRTGRHGRYQRFCTDEQPRNAWNDPANQTARQTDIANLEAATQTQDPSQQTIMAELQRINQALLLQLRTMQDANQINANLALQTIVAQKQQQDALKRDSRTLRTTQAPIRHTLHRPTTVAHKL